MTETAVVILNFNGSHFLKQFLPSVIRHSGDAKIVVADNGSTDDSLAVLQNSFPSVDVIAIGTNLGFCGGYNFALKKVNAEYFVLLNSDIEVTPNWISPIIDIFKKELSIAAAQPKILSYHQKEMFEYAGAGGGYLDTLGYPFCRGRIFDAVEKDHGQYNDARQVFWATGACLFIRSNLYHQLGGLDEDFFAHMEEIDLCWKLNRLGYKVYYEPRSKVYHVGGGTLSKSNPRKTYLNFRNGLSLIFKHLSPTDLIWKLPLRMMLDWLAAIKFGLDGSWADGWMVMKAHWAFLKNLSAERSKRKELSTKNTYKWVPSPYQGLIVLDFYVRGKKDFSKLDISNPK